MPTNLKRHNVTFPAAIYATIEKDAALNERSISGQIIFILKGWYADKEREADLFRATPLHEAKHHEAPVFETPAQIPAEPLSTIHKSSGQEKS